MDPYNTAPAPGGTPADPWGPERTKRDRLPLNYCELCGNTHRNPGNARFCPDTGEP